MGGWGSGGEGGGRHRQPLPLSTCGEEQEPTSASLERTVTLSRIQSAHKVNFYHVTK